MIKLILGKEKECKKNITPKEIEPNITEDTIFIDEETGKAIGFYIKEAPERLRKITTLANNELLSDNVPKSKMARVWGEDGKSIRLEQFSTIIGGVKPEIIKRRYKPGLSHVHMHKPAEKYIRLIYLFALECEKIIKEITPELYEFQKEAIKDQQIKIGNLWTSSIANFNTAAKTHIDGANKKGCGNIIYFKRENANGGHLHLPGYDAVINSKDDSFLFYPAVKTLHGVSEIIPTKDLGYRNSLVLYPLNIKWND